MNNYGTGNNITNDMIEFIIDPPTVNINMLQNV